MRLTEKQQEIYEELFVRYPVLEKNREAILKAYEVLETCYRTGGKLLVAGNGGSCADAEHIVGELMKGFKKRRPLDETLQCCLAMEDTKHGAELARSLQGSLRAIALDGHPGLSTAFANDVDADMIFAQQVCGYGDKEDVFGDIDLRKLEKCGLCGDRRESERLKRHWSDRKGWRSAWKAGRCGHHRPGDGDL